MARTAFLIALCLAAPLQAREWSLGADPLYPTEASLWNTGEKWGYGITLGGPQIGKSDADDNEMTTAEASGSLTIQRFRGRTFFFGEARAELYRHRWADDRSFKVKAGIGISRKYKDLGLFISHGLIYRVREDDDGDRSWAAGLEGYPRVVIYWTL